MFMLVVELNLAKCRLPKGPKFVLSFESSNTRKISLEGGGSIFFPFKQGGWWELTLDDTMVLKGIITACHHMPTWMVAWDFSHVYSLWILWQSMRLSHALVFHMSKPDIIKFLKLWMLLMTFIYISFPLKTSNNLGNKSQVFERSDCLITVLIFIMNL